MLSAIYFNLDCQNFVVCEWVKGHFVADQRYLVSSVQDLKNKMFLVPRTDDSLCNRIHSSLTFVHWLCGKKASCLRKNIVQSTGKKNSRRPWGGALATAIKLN